MRLDPSQDGVTHVNVYSKGKTLLGRMLSNFARTPFRLPFLGSFESVEGFWYWWVTRNEQLRTLHGYEAKSIGRQSIQIYEEPSERVLRLAYKAKLRYNPKIRALLESNDLPLVHYYVYKDKVVSPTKYLWTAKLWEKL